MKHSLLGARFLAAGGPSIVVGNWEIPARIGTPEEDYAAIRFQAGILDLSHRTRLRITGSNRMKFLQGILTNDANTLEPGRGLYAAILSPKGKMQADVTVYALDDWLWADAEAEVAGTLPPILTRYTIGTDATVGDLSLTHGVIGVYGPAAADTLALAFKGWAPPTTALEVGVLTAFDTRLIVAESGYPAAPGYKLLTPSEALEAVWTSLIEAGAKTGARPVGWNALETVRIEEGRPRYGIDMGTENFPPEARIEDRAVSYTKGCYMGQETIARIRTYGHVNRLFVGLLPDIDRPIAPGTKLYHPQITSVLRENKEAGYVTSSTYSPALKRVIALGYVHRTLETPGTEVTVGERDPIRATVVALPFAPPASPLP